MKRRRGRRALARRYSRPNVEVTGMEILAIIGGVVVVGWLLSVVVGAVRA